MRGAPTFQAWFSAALALVCTSACGHDSSARGDAGPSASVLDASKDAASGNGNADASAAVGPDAGRDARASNDDDAGDAASTSTDAGSDGGPKLPVICEPGASYGSPLSAASVTATKIKEGFAFTEGAVWVESLGALLFSEMLPAVGTENVQPAKIWRLTLPSTFDVWLDASGSNGLALSPDHTRLLAATHDQQSVSAYRIADKHRETIVGMYGTLKFHSPNDLTARSDGTVYFTDPSFQQGNRPSGVVSKTAVYRVGKNGIAVVVDDGIANPNGIALSPDEKTLYVGGDGAVRKYAVHANGSTDAAQPFASGFGAPDGMTVDCAGNVYVTDHATGLVHVIDSDGTHLGTIATDAHATNAAFGGEDGKTLFITAGNSDADGFGIYAIKLGVPGRPY